MTTETFLLPPLAELPEGLQWLEDKLTGLLKPCAFVSTPGSDIRKPRPALPPAPQGATRFSGLPDVPADAPWRNSPWCHRLESPHDEEVFWFQLDLAEIPPSVREPHWPTQGIVWGTLDLSGRGREEPWVVETFFDPRARADIPWLPRKPSATPVAPQVVFELKPSLPFCDDKVLPEISWDWKGQGLCHQYDEWMLKHYGDRREDIRIGGWMHSIQGFDSDESLVMSMEDQGFGDCGAVYLHYDAEKGFWGEAQTA